MKEKRCKYCIYLGYSAGGIKTCDYILIMGRSRIAQMTPEERKQPCKFFDDGVKIRRVVRLPDQYRCGGK